MDVPAASSRSTGAGLPLPVLGARVRLERLGPAHAEAVLAYHSLPQVNRYQSAFDVKRAAEAQLERLPLAQLGWCQSWGGWAVALTLHDARDRMAPPPAAYRTPTTSPPGLECKVSLWHPIVYTHKTRDKRWG